MPISAFNEVMKANQSQQARGMLNAKFEFMEEMVSALFLLCIIYLFYLNILPKAGEMQKNILSPIRRVTLIQPTIPISYPWSKIVWT